MSIAASEIWRTKVIVGKPETQTVAFSDEIETVVFNPSWGVPQSIIRNEMLPMLRRDPGYLDRLGYRVVAPNGKIVKSRSVNWWASARDSLFGPSSRRAMTMRWARSNFCFPTSTTSTCTTRRRAALFAQSERAFSHGCVRVENPRVFAEILLGWAPDKVAESIEGGASKTVKVKNRTVRFTSPISPPGPMPTGKSSTMTISMAAMQPWNARLTQRQLPPDKRHNRQGTIFQT